MGGAVKGSHDSEERPMQMITTIGLDIAKSVFQVHGVDAAGEVIIRRQLRRRSGLALFQKLPPCLVGIEACASSHHWSRELQALGHTVRLMPPAYVKPYVKRQKNDAADAEAFAKRSREPTCGLCQQRRSSRKLPLAGSRSNFRGRQVSAMRSTDRAAHARADHGADVAQAALCEVALLHEPDVR